MTRYHLFGPPKLDPNDTTRVAKISKVLSVGNRTVEETQAFEAVKQAALHLDAQEKKKQQHREAKQRWRERKRQRLSTTYVKYVCGVCNELKLGIDFVPVTNKNPFGTLCKECKDLHPEHAPSHPPKKKEVKKRKRRVNVFRNDPI